LDDDVVAGGVFDAGVEGGSFALVDFVFVVGDGEFGVGGLIGKDRLFGIVF